MTCDVRISEQVDEFIRQLSPVPRKRLRDELRKLALGSASTKSLVEPLEGYHRISSGNYRVVFRYEMHGGRQIALCIHAGPRSIIYEQFEKQFKPG